MPSSGKPSTGCAECKKRHVKCDEQKPACGRCVRAQRECPGYAQGLDLVLRIQNQKAKKAVEKRELISKSKRGDDTLSLVSHPSPYCPSSSSSPPFLNAFACETGYPGNPGPVILKTSRSPLCTPVYPTLTQPEDAVAVAFLMAGYVNLPVEAAIDRGILRYLPQFWQKADSSSPIALSTIATGRLLLNAWERGIRDPELPRVRIAFGKALSATRAALADPVRRLTDETLAAVCVLAVYEAIAEAFRSKVSSSRHYEGAMALFRYRRNEGVRSQMSSELLSSVRYNIITRAMVNGTVVQPHNEIWQDDEAYPDHPTTQLDLLCIEVAAILALEKEISTKSASGEDTVADIQKLLVRAQACDLRLAGWSETIPAEFTPIQLPGQAIPLEVLEMGVYGDTCDIYAHLMQSSMWNDWRCARLRILRMICRLDDGQDGKEAAKTIQTLVDAICASIPFALGSRVGRQTTLFDESPSYPFLRGEAELRAHKIGAAAFGGWQLFTPFVEMLKSSACLRSGQALWILMQFMRLREIHNAPKSNNYDVMKHFPELKSGPWI